MRQLVVRRLLTPLVFTLCLFAVGVQTASATHFLGGKLTWARDFSYVSPGAMKINFTFQASWRASFAWTQYPTVGAVMSPFYQITFTPVSGAPQQTYDLQQAVLTLNNVEDWFTAQYQFSIIFPLNAFPVTAVHVNCCRSSVLLERNNDTNWELTTVIDPSKGSRSPDSAMLPRIYLQQNALNQFLIPNTAFDGYTNVVEIAPMTDSQLLQTRPVGAPFAINGAPQCANEPLTGQCSVALRVSSSGLVQWTPQTAGLYAMQLKVTSVDPSTGARKTSMPLDFLLDVVASCGTCPTLTVTAPPSVNATIGLPVTFDVTVGGTNLSASTVTLGHTPLPNGASLSAETGSAPLSSTFSWTPPAGATDQFVCFQATASPQGTVSLGQTCTTIHLQPNLPAQLFCSAPQTLTALSPSGAPATLNVAVQDLEQLATTYRYAEGVTLFSGTVPAGSIAATPTSLTRTFAIGSHNVVFTAFDGVQDSSCTMTVNVLRIPQALTFTPPAQVSFGSPALPLMASSNGPLPVSYQVVSGPGVLAGNMLSFNGVGTVELKATQAGDTIYAPATDVFAMINVVDTTAPTIAPHGNESAEAAGSSGALVAYAPPGYTDDVDPAGIASCAPASGSLFPIGATTVSCTAADAAGNSASSSFTVSVGDSAGPVIGAVDNLSAEANGAGGAVVNYTSPLATDAVDGDVAVTCLPASGSMFAPGNTVVTCTATDAHSNSSSTTFTVGVHDSTPPVIDPVAAINAEATALNTVVNYAVPAAHDQVDGAVAVSCNPASGTAFPLTTTTVNCSAADAAGNIAHSAFAVTISDLTGPAVAAHGAESAEATSASGAVVSYATPSATDLVDGATAVTCAPVSGSTFPIGATTVTCSSVDARGNSGSSAFSVTVSDSTPPVIAAHGDETAVATSAAGAVVNYTLPLAHDSIDGAVAVTCLPASGSTFHGASTVTCSAADSHGNAAVPVTFTVTVTNAAPTFTPPMNIVAEALNAAGRAVTYSASGNDLEDGPIAAVCSPLSGSVFPIGTTTVNCTVTDIASATAAGSFTVTVRDTTAPVVTYAGNAGSYSVAQTVNITCAATDAVGVTASTCAPISGAAYTFGVGAHNYSATATDAAGNVGTGTATFTVTSSLAAVQQLVNLFCTNPGVCSGLNAKLTAAASAPNGNARRGQLGAFENQVHAQTGKCMTAEQAAILLQLVQAFY